jgi:hypothetical protein
MVEAESLESTGHKETAVFNTFFETSHCLTAEHLARMYGFDILLASDEDSLVNRMNDLYAQNESHVYWKYLRLRKMTLFFCSISKSWFKTNI